MSFLRDFFLGSPEKHERVSTLAPEQQKLFQQLMSALSAQGAGGAFGQSADYFRSILEDNPELMQQFFAPEMRKFNEQTIPDLSHQFAGMGSGALSSSGFRNAAISAGTDLQERLGAIRAQLKQQAAGGLSNLGQMGLGNYSQDVMTQGGSPGLVGAVGQGFGQAVGQGLGSWATSKFGKTNPYGNKPSGV